MADKRISDFPTLEGVRDNDLFLVSSQDDTYNIRARTFKTAVAGEVAEEMTPQFDEIHQQLNNVSINPDDLSLYQDPDTGYVYPVYRGVASENGIPLASSGGGGGGGGGSLQYTLTLTNTLPERVITAAEGQEVILAFDYASVDEHGDDDGGGIGTLMVNNVPVATYAISQGSNTLEISNHLAPGSSSVKLRVENSEGTARTLLYTVTVISLSITSPLDTMGIYTGSVVFNYTVTGTGDKTIHFIMDGVEQGTSIVKSSGRSQSYIILGQPDGAHIFSVYASVEINGTLVTSNVITFGMLWASDSMSVPAVLSTFSQHEADQGEILSIPYLIYDPSGETATVTLSVLDADSAVVFSQTLTVDRTPQVWTIQNYPAGQVTFKITCRGTEVSFPVLVSDTGETPEAVEDALALYFDPVGRSNLEENPESWTDGNVTATFSGIGFASADGWLTDSDGAAIFRILPGGQMTIPFQLFASDARSSGATVEVEMATHNVRDYDTVVMSCLSGGRGFKIASQYAEIRSEQSQLSMQFKEDEKVRVSFVVEPRNLHRLIYVFVDGILCGAIRYPENDDFSQSPAAGLTIGATSSGIDLYKIRLYTKGLTRGEILDNYIADRALLMDRKNLTVRNDIFDQSENIVISKLPSTLPYMVIKCPELPQYKGDKKTCQIEYVNPADSSRSFTAANVQIDVQGTSSAGYKKKNWKLKFQNGVTYSATGLFYSSYQLREDSVPAKSFCMKADVASSEGANNVELVRLYNDTAPVKTPPQVTDSRVRVGIDGLPCIIFWQNTVTNEVRFWGKYNFNDEKSSNQVFGLSDGCESWEICNNTSNRVIFKSSDFSGNAWKDDFEARYPEDSVDYTQLKAMCDWVVSTDRSAVNTPEAKAARLEKFRTEFEDHFVKDAMLFYYLFTETFLMVDSRAKNFFPSTFDGVHWLPLPYDMDTAIGINNEGQLVFDYDLEDTDIVSGSNVFNGQESVLWCNIRDAFPEELAAMYSRLRSGSLFNYAEVVRRYTAHQTVWPEAVWNEDAWEKYLEPLENDNDGSYLAMLQGNKASQREWWLFNGFRYRDSKYQCGDAQSQFITLRCYAVGDITVTPYSHIWPRIKYGSATVTQRGKRNIPATLHCPLDTMNDTEVYIYSADRLSTIGDLSPLQVGYANFSMATKLQSLKLGDGANSYENTRLTELYVGNNELLTSLDVRNCINLVQTVDLSGCVGVETVRAAGSSVTGFNLPVGGKLKTLELPGTVTNLTLRDLSRFEALSMAGYGSLTTLRIENTPNIPYETIINGAAALNRVRLINVEWTATSEATLQTSITRLKGCIGMDAAGNNTENAVVTGRVYVPSISADLLTEINDAFPQLVVVAGGEPQYIVRYLDWDNTLLYRLVVSEGGSAINPVATGAISAPTREGTENTGYTFKDFGVLPTNIHDNIIVYAVYEGTYRVRFMDGATVYKTQWVVSGQDATPPANPTKASTAQYTYTFSRWNGTYTNVTHPVDITAVFNSTVRKYTVYFYNGSTLLQTVENVPYGSSATFTGTTPVDTSGENQPFEGWNPSPTNIQGNTSCYAVFASPLEIAEITDTWDQILQACANGTAVTRYKVGNYKPLDLGTEGVVNMQIIGKSMDNLADGTGTASLTWLSKELLKTSHRMNPLRDGESGNYTEGTGAIGGWEKSEMRTYLADTIKPKIPENVRQAIQTVLKSHLAYNTAGSSFTQTTEDDVWLPSYNEMFASSGSTNQPRYKVIFSDNDSRKKMKVDATSASYWWLRSAYYDTLFYYVNSSGNNNGNNANSSYGVALGFCT